MEDINFDLKKKKKKNKITLLNIDHEYTYDEMLQRVYSNLKKDNPTYNENKNIILEPIKVVREGMRTVFLNFDVECKILNRDRNHMFKFILVELGTTGSLNGTNQMIIKGKFNTEEVKTIFLKYVNDYVRCPACKSLNTTLEKKERITRIDCKRCTSSNTAKPIEVGYIAQLKRVDKSV